MFKVHYKKVRQLLDTEKANKIVLILRIKYKNCHEKANL